VQGLGVVLVTLSLVHTPLPQPDFHNIRHHDGPGEVCEHHDHLLRWHPGAGVARDVAVLHWHWFFPATDGTEPALDPGSPGSAVHAHTPDWSACPWDVGPQLTAAAAARLDPRPAAGPPPLPFLTLAPDDPGAGPTALTRPPSASGAPLAPRVPLTSLLHRWVC
jgi:hypothetical protein